MGEALERLARRLDQSAIVELAIRVRSHLRKTEGGITDVEAYMRSVEHLDIPVRSRSAITKRPGQPARGESGYMYSPRRGELGPSPSKASRLRVGTTETRADRWARLQKKLVDYKPERPLEGGEDIRQVIPGTAVKEYLDLPFLDAMHERMGIDVDTVSIDEYVEKRNALFSPANTTDEEVPFDGLTVTQKMVNRDQARKFIGKEFDPPPYVVRYRGTDYVINGHHRVVAESLAGKSSTRARVLDLGNRLVARLARTEVRRHLRKTEHGIEDVARHQRVQGVGVPEFKPTERVKNLPTLNLPTGPRTFTDEQLKRAQLIETRVAQAKLEGKDTFEKYFAQVGEDEGGKPVLKIDPERKKQHEEIVNHFWEQEFAHVPSEGKAVISGGIGGAGKSTILKKHADIDREAYGTVNPDDIKEYMAEHGMTPEVEGLDPMEASALIHEESSYLAAVLAQRAYGEKKNLIWDITMSSPGSVQKRIDDLHTYGYSEIKGVFVDIPVETSAKRAVARWWGGHQDRKAGKNKIGGRYVSPALIRQQAAEHGGTKNRENFDSFRAKFDEWEVWNTEAAQPTKIASSPAKGRI